MQKFLRFFILTSIASTSLCFVTHAQQSPAQTANYIPYGVVVEYALPRTKSIKPYAPKQQSKQAQRTSLGTRRNQSACGNLIDNGYFDGPNFFGYSGRINNVLSPAAGSDELPSWKATNYSTPDYYNTSAPAGSASNPASASSGAFVPFSGVGAIGLVGTNEIQPNRPSSFYYSEQVTQLLAQPLSSEHYYYASLRAYSAPTAQYASSIGIYITTRDPTDYTRTSNTPSGGISYSYAKSYTPATNTTNPPGCGMQSQGLISSSQWTLVSGTFRGIQGAQYVNIGNFQPGNKQLIRPGARDATSYSYVDNIELYEIPDAGPAQITLCNGGSVTIGQGCDIPGATYAWTIKGSSAPAFASTIQTVVNVTTTTTYTLTVTLPDRTTSVSSVAVSVTPPAPNPISGNPEICYDRMVDGSDRTTLTINTPAPAGYTYYAQLVDNATGQVVDDNLNNFTRNNGPFNYFLIGGNYSVGNYTLRVRYQGACPSAWQTRPIFIKSCTPQDKGGPCTGRECDGARAATAYPNPAAETLSLPEGVQQATIISSQGGVMQIDSNAKSVDVRKLPDGLYNLRMKREDKIINQHIQIKH